MTNAIRIHQTGGPEVLCWEQVDVPAPAAGEATVRHQPSGSISSTPTTAPGSIRCPCRRGSVSRVPAWSRRSVRG